MRARNFADRALDVGDGVEAHRLRHVDARFHELLAALDGGVLAFDARGVRARDDEEIGIAARVEHGLHFREHLLGRDDLLSGQIAAAVRKHLVADEETRDAGRLEGAHHLTHVVDTAEAGVGVHIDRDLDRVADARCEGVAVVQLLEEPIPDAAGRVPVVRVATARAHGLLIKLHADELQSGGAAELAADIVDNGIILAGGGALLANLDILIKEKILQNINKIF